MATLLRVAAVYIGWDVLGPMAAILVAVALFLFAFIPWLGRRR